MRNVLFLFVWILFSHHLTAQFHWENEPNDDFESAQLVTAGSGDYNINGTIDYFSEEEQSDVDVYKINLPDHYPGKVAGNYRLSFSLTNSSEWERDDTLTVEIYNSDLEPLVGSADIAVPSWSYDLEHTLEICGQSLEEVYILLRSKNKYWINYRFKLNVFPAYADMLPEELTDFRGTAPVLTEPLFEKNSFAIGYTIRDEFEGDHTDSVDYYKLGLIPTSLADTLRIIGQNLTCQEGKYIHYTLFRNDETTSFKSGFVGGTDQFSTDMPMSSHIALDEGGFVEGDSLVIRILTNGIFGYDFAINSAGTEDESFNDREDNCCVNNAVPLEEGSYTTGKIGDYLIDNSSFDPFAVVDREDTYFLTPTAPGVVKLFVEATNIDCDAPDVYLKYELLDKNGNSLFGSPRDLFDWAGFGLPCETTLTDTIRFAVNMDSVYVRLSTGKGIIIIGRNGRAAVTQPDGTFISYRLKYETYYQTDYIDPEPNNSATEAVSFPPGTVVEGNLNFMETDYEDNVDYYKLTLAEVSDINFEVKVRFLDNDRSYSGNSPINLHIPGHNLSKRVPATFGGILKSDSVYTETYQVCGLQPGENYLALFGGFNALEYEISYQVTNSLSWPGDSLSSNTQTGGSFIDPEVEYTGHLGYRETANNVRDQYDYYKIALPESGNVRVNIELRNPSCEINTVPFRANIRNQASTYLRNVTLNNGLSPGETILASADFCGIRGADTLYLGLYHNSVSSSSQANPFLYRFTYEVLDVVPEDFGDPEPNNNFSQAVLVQEGQTNKGSVGYTQDVDFYKFYSAGDVIEIPFEITNRACGNDHLIVRAYGGNQTLITSKRLGGGANNMAPGQTKSDVFTFNLSEPDSIYLEINYWDDRADAMLYTFTLNGSPPSSSFSLAGDTTVCFGPVAYKAKGLTDPGNLTYHWSLPDGGGAISGTDSTATVDWNVSGNRRVALYLSNEFGTSETKYLHVLVNNDLPTQVPLLYQSGRKLFSQGAPPGAGYQWYRNGGVISEATDSVYIALADGSYTVRYTNDCGEGPASNQVAFAGAGQAQNISFPAIADIMLAPGLKIKLPAVSSSGLPVQYTKTSGAGYIQSDTLYVSGWGILTGPVTIKATQPGDVNWLSAEEVYQTVNVLKGNQTVSFEEIGNQVFNTTPVSLYAQSDVSLPVSYSIISGSEYAQISGGQLIKKGVGSVTVRASQGGNGNYNPSNAVDRSFCIGVRKLNSISGAAEPCTSTYRYTTDRIPGANYVWSLSGGGTLVTSHDTAWVSWTAASGTYQLSVKANSACDATYSNEISKNITISTEAPDLVSGMLPAEGTQDAGLPLTLSWFPTPHAISYDLFIWEASEVRPSAPYASDLSSISFTIPQHALDYNTDYAWSVTAKNPCAYTEGPVQQFRLRPLPDLEAGNVQLPISANSGQNIGISWEVVNTGPGNTRTNEHWKDAVFLSIDPEPNLKSAATNPASWPNYLSPRTPLLIGTKNNVSGLESGESYSNSINFRLPVHYKDQLYAYVITDYGSNAAVSPLQVSRDNDTTSAAHAMDVMLTPTPDLRVDQVSVPSTVFSGSTVNITYQVRNYGALTPVSSTWQDSLFISQNPLFNQEDCIPLTRPKSAGNYYPDAPTAVIFANDTLEANESYTRSTEVVIPNFVMGPWFVYVKTNAGEMLYEGVLTDNNIGQAQLEVLLTPTPRLVVQNITLPLTEASTTQTIGANWEIRNEGFNDQMERNKGHYIEVLGSCVISCPPGSGRSSGSQAVICYGTSINDSIGYGSSYWTDKIYLSTNPSALVPENAHLVKSFDHGTQGSGLNVADSYPGCGYLGSSINVSHVLNPNAVFPVASSFKIPENLPEGDYYLYIHTNSNKTVYEYPGVAEIKRSTLPITISRPDLTVSIVDSPASAASGTTVSIQYSVGNQGVGSLFNQRRIDRLYISDFPDFDASAELVASREYTGSIMSSDSEEFGFEYAIPFAASGTKYFYVVTNEDELFNESSHTNNRSVAAGVSVSLTTPADLVVQSMAIADTVSSLASGAIVYTIIDQQEGGFAGTWTDEVYVSCSATFDENSAWLIGTRTKYREILPGQAHIDTLSYELGETMHALGACFADGYFSEAYFFIKINADASAYEGPNTGNNLTASAKKVVLNPYVDHTVRHIGNVPATLLVGRPVSPVWTVKNLAYKPADGYYSTSWDAVYLSVDPVLSENDLKIYEYRVSHRVEMGDSTVVGRSFNLPDIPEGDYYFIVRTNDRQTLSVEWNTANNYELLKDPGGAPLQISVEQSDLPDLIDELLVFDNPAAAGQPFTLVHKITNTGVGENYPSSWRNSIWLSADTEINGGDLLLRNTTTSATLLPGESKNDTLTVLVPMQTSPGSYYLLVEVNADKKIVESSHTNNVGVGLIQIYEQPASDLVVEHVALPDTIYLGEPLTGLGWEVRNLSSNTARGTSVDGVYLSKSPGFDSTAVLVGSISRQIDIDPVSSEQFSFNPLVSNVKEGDYYVFVRADIQNHINESDKANNTGTAPQTLHVKVRGLKLEEQVQNTLSANTLYYKLTVPDSLLGSTIRVSLTTNEPLSSINEIYLGGGYIPSPAQFDYRFGTPNYGDQQVIMSSVVNTEYYVAIRCVNPNPPAQNISLLAEVMPFAILAVSGSSGGNIGNVTVRIDGTLFTENMTATLHGPEATIITASAVYNINSTGIFATFNLLGAPLGMYDVRLAKPDGSTATLPTGFAVEAANNGGLLTGSGPNTIPGNGDEPGCDPGAASGMNSQLALELVVPSSAPLGASVAIQVNYHNPTNYDIPAQTRVLSSVDGVKMALSKEQVPNGTASIYLKLVEPGGPEGIIRAGGRGSVTIYTTVPLGRSINPVPFNLQ